MLRPSLSLLQSTDHSHRWNCSRALIAKAIAVLGTDEANTTTTTNTTTVTVTTTTAALASPQIGIIGLPVHTLSLSLSSCTGLFWRTFLEVDFHTCHYHLGSREQIVTCCYLAQLQSQPAATEVVRCAEEMSAARVTRSAKVSLANWGAWK